MFRMNPEQFDLIAIGDITTDAFIRITEEIHLRPGEKVPYESVTVVPGVGNSANAAATATGAIALQDRLL